MAKKIKKSSPNTCYKCDEWCGAGDEFSHCDKKVKPKTKPRYDYIGRAHYEMMNSGNGGTKRVLRKLVIEAAMKMAATFGEDDHLVKRDAKKISKELIP